MNEPADLSDWTFDEIAEKYGREAAIQAGIAADPDTWELTEDDFAQMRPASEVHPELVESWRAAQVKQDPAFKNQLYFGDNLDILRNHIPDASVDLIYLDPPFNSNANYNVLFQEKGGQQSAAQITAFEDTWQWSLESEIAYQDVVTNATGKLPALLQAMRQFLGTNDMMAYLTMMAQRMVELHRVLKNTGSIYLHCDPTASHYLKLLMDSVFGRDLFKAEITWQRTSTHNDSTDFANVSDSILFYSNSAINSDAVRIQLDPSYIKSHYGNSDARGAYRTDNLTGPGLSQGESGKPWRGYDPGSIGRCWSVPRTGKYASWIDENIIPGYKSTVSVMARLDALDQANLIYHTPQGQVPQLKRYLDANPGQVPSNIWVDIPPINSQAKERLGYPTQKPEALLERIVRASSNEGDVVLDPFCGCGTAIAAAERLNRRWIGIDITHIAITLIRHRLHDTFKGDIRPYEVLGQPQDIASAQALASDSENSGRYQFEWWALGLVDARPARDRKKGADSGIDGYINFFDDNSGKAKRIVAQVKSGNVTRNQVATLKGDMEREKAEIGLFITLKPPTGPMESEAVSAGFYTPEHYPDSHYPRIQILTIAELLAGKQVQYPRVAPEATFQRAPRRRRAAGTQPNLV